MSTPTTVLVTGANKGIGYAIAAGLGALGWEVGVGARDPQRLEAAVDGLRNGGVNAFGVLVDVTDADSVSAAAKLIEERGNGLDVLVNNAGIIGGVPQEPTTADPETMLRAIDTNVFGVVRVTNAMLPLLRGSSSPRIVNISSRVGSLTLQTKNDFALTGPISVAYAPSKSYLNAVTVQYAKELADTNILVNAGCPGFIGTDLNGHRGTGTPEEGARVAIELATLPDDGPSGSFFEAGAALPW